MSHKKAGGSSSNGRDSKSKRLGVKLSDGQYAKTGAIIIRQRGTKYHPGLNVEKGRDDSLFATMNGIVKFSTKKNIAMYTHSYIFLYVILSDSEKSRFNLIFTGFFTALRFIQNDKIFLYYF